MVSRDQIPREPVDRARRPCRVCGVGQGDDRGWAGEGRGREGEEDHQAPGGLN